VLRDGLCLSTWGTIGWESNTIEGIEFGVEGWTLFEYLGDYWMGIKLNPIQFNAMTKE